MRIKSICVLLLAILVMSFTLGISLTVRAADGPNILTNPGFENGFTTPWYSGVYALGYYVGASTVSPHSGTKCGLAQMWGSTNPAYYVSIKTNYIYIDNTKNYMVSAWNRHIVDPYNSYTTTTSISLRCFTPTTGDLVKKEITVWSGQGTSTWTLRGRNVLASELYPNTDRVDIVLKTAGPGQAASQYDADSDYWDDVAIYTKTWSINASADPSVGGAVSGAGTYDDSADVQLVATANPGYRFDKWTENGNDLNQPANFSFKALNDRTLVAHFVAEPIIPVVSSISPSSSANIGVVSVALTGEHFTPGASVRLERGGTTIEATSVSFVSDTSLTCNLDLAGKPLGKYDVIVRNADGQEGKLSGAFSVTDICGQGAGASISVFIGLLGLMSLTGLRLRRRPK